MKKDNKRKKAKLPSSFRDPSGFLFLDQDILLRQINYSYKENYDYFIDSGLYDKLYNKGLLIFHKEGPINKKFSDEAYKVIQPEVIPFISYPYEWCFSQLKDAALLTLKIQRHSLDHDMTLKDASSYNIQFLNGKPVFIDTLSFEKYKDGTPWVAYRQFCQHFLAPLALMSYKNIYLQKFLISNIDGISLDLASSILPFKTFLNPAIYANIHLQAKIQKRLENKNSNGKRYVLSKKSLIALVESLSSLVSSLQWQPKDTEWADYYVKTNYSEKAFLSKKQIVGQFLERLNPSLVFDIGANQGDFSRIYSCYTISFDSDPAAVEKNYLQAKKNGETNILPFVFDILNPSPSIGWMNRERDSLQNRAYADAVLALALTHHLAITSGLSFGYIAEFFSKLGKNLVIEFIPKEDSKVNQMIAQSIKTFDDYTQKNFEESFKEYFLIKEKKQVEDSKRILYLMETL